MPDRVYLHPIDPELLPGARNAIHTCLQLKPQERITIITDTVTRGIAAALQSEVERVGSKYSLFVLEHHARRPLPYMHWRSFSGTNSLTFTAAIHVTDALCRVDQRQCADCARFCAKLGDWINCAERI